MAEIKAPGRDAAAAPRTVRLAGMRLVVRPLDDAAYAEFERFVQDRYAEVAVSNARRLIDDEEERRAVIGQALQHAAGLTMASKESLRIMASMDGAVKLTWLYLRRDNDVTEERVRELLNDPQTLEEAMGLIDATEGWVAELRRAMGSATRRAERKGKAVAAAKRKPKPRRRGR
jgi:hypothetical protein